MQLCHDSEIGKTINDISVSVAGGYSYPCTKHITITAYDSHSRATKQSCAG